MSVECYQSCEMATKVAVVTGSNKGIGYGTVRELLKRGYGVVYLTARNEARGNDAVEKLKKEGFEPQFHKLDVADSNSVKEFADFLKQKHGGLDLLINNAAVMNENLKETTYEDAQYVIKTNYNSLFTVQEYLYPILKNNARVINMSSECGHISNIKNKYWIERLTKNDLKVNDVNAFVNWFLDSVKKNLVDVNDFNSPEIIAYKVSKVAVSALTRIQQKEIGRNISIHSMHPGFVKTDMTKNYGMLTVSEASEAVVYVALDVDQALKGRYFWYDKTERDWSDHSQQLHANPQEQEDYLKSVNFYDIK